MTTEYSIQKMVSDGTLSTIALGIKYLQRNDIYMRVAGEETPQSGAPNGYTWSFLDNTTLKILPVVPNGVEVVVYRRTDVDAMYNIYSQNAQFDEATIDENNQQLLYIAQEYLEQGIPGAGVDTLEFVRDDGTYTYYRIKRTDGSYSDEFAVPSACSATKIFAREALRRSYAEAGYNLVDGSFEAGGTLVNANDVLLQERTGKVFSGPAGVVAAGTNPASGGFVAQNMASLRTDLNGANGASLLNFTPDYVPSLSPINVQLALRNRRNITDLGAVSGVASADVDAKVVAAVAADYAIALPNGFNYKTAGTLNMPSLKSVIFLCPDGRAKVTASVAGLMFDSPNTFKFEGSYFKNIDFVGADKQNSASRWMYAEEGKSTANFITEDCSWDGFHTISKASCIAVKHYRPKYYGCGDTGAVVDTYHWTTTLFSAFNLNEWHEPIFIGKFGRLFKILGGTSNYLFSPWFEKVETVSNEMILMRQHFNMQIIGGWLENFKTQFLFNLDGDGTENTQSDICVIDGLHINNNWSLDPTHSGQASGFVALFNRLTPQFMGNQYDTKFVFRNLFEHPDSVVGWALTRTGSALNIATSLHEFVGCRLKTGQPNASDGMSLAGNSPDLRRHFRDLSSNKLDLIPNNYQIISGRNTTGSQKDLVFDNSGDTAYFRRNGVQLIRWGTSYFAPGTANALLCGTASTPWSGGNTQTAYTVTSDENYKTNIASILNSTEEEAKAEFMAMRAAWREVDYCMYQLIDRVAAKGSDVARWHLGVVAQRAIEAFTRHGLDWTKYAIFNYDKWDAEPAIFDDEGNLMRAATEAGERYSINYQEAGILQDAIHREDDAQNKATIQDLLARIEALENR